MSFAVVSPILFAGAKDSLSRHRFDVIEITPAANIDSRFADHPDIQMFSAFDTVFVHYNFSPETERLIALRNNVIRCSKKLKVVYPEDCSYNIAFTGKYALYKQGIIPDEIESFFNTNRIIKIHVPQGYARCSTIILADDAIATEDIGIAVEAEKSGLTVIRLTPGLIPLKGFPRGFAGGICGLFNKTLYVTGQLPEEESYQRLRAYCSGIGVAINELCAEHARDFGSILFI
jgi:hypothetical protein